MGWQSRLRNERKARKALGLPSVKLRRAREFPPRTATFWNGEPCEARIVRVIVGKPDRPTWWFAGLEGTEREAVEVKQHGQTTYLDNEGDGKDFTPGNAWRKVTIGMGSPQWGHMSLRVERVIEEAH